MLSIDLPRISSFAHRFVGTPMTTGWLIGAAALFVAVLSVYVHVLSDHVKQSEERRWALRHAPRGEAQAADRSTAAYAPALQQAQYAANVAPRP